MLEEEQEEFAKARAARQAATHAISIEVQAAGGDAAGLCY